EVLLRAYRPGAGRARVAVLALRAPRPGARHARARRGAAVRPPGEPRPHQPRGRHPHRRVRLRAQPARVRPDDVARAQVGEQPVWRVLLYGELPRGPHGARSGRRPAPPGDAPGRPDLAPAAARPREAVLRVHGVLGLPHVGTVPGDLVREPAGRDLLHLLPLIGQWKPVGVAVFFLVLVIPFVGLLGVKPKKSPPI